MAGVLSLKFAHIVKSHQGLIVHLPVGVGVESIFHKYFFDFIFFLRRKSIFMVFEVRVSIDSH